MMEKHLFNFIDQYMPLTEEEKKAIIDLNIIRGFKKETILVEKGDVIKGGYFVIKGCLRCYYIIDNEEKTTGFYTEGESLTVVSNTNTTRSAHYVSCVEDSIVTIGNPEMGKETIEKFPRFQKLCLIMSEQLVVKNLTAFADFKNSSTEQRYLNLLETKPDLLQRAPLHQIASFLGMKPQSLSRIRKRIAQKDNT